MNKKKLCINPGAIATSLGHFFSSYFHSRPVAYHRFISPPPVANDGHLLTSKPEMWCKWCERQDNGSVFLDVRAGHAGRKDDDDGCDVRVTLSKPFHQRARRPLTLGSERRDLSWTVVHSDIRSYYEWCQTTFSFLARVSRRAASSRPLVCVRLGSRPNANIWPASSPSYCPQSVHQSDRPQCK